MSNNKGKQRKVEVSEILAEVKKDMQRAKVTQEQIAEASNQSTSNVHRKLNGKLPLTLDDAVAIGKALGYTDEQFTSRFYPNEFKH